jgi:multidrug resistance efflux pump
MIKSPRNFVLVFIFFIFFLLFIYNFSYLFPFTNNAFVVSDIRPVASAVDGTIEEIYIKNGEMVKKGQPLMKINQKLHLYEYLKAKNDLVTAKLYLQNLKNESEILVHKSKINSLILKKKLAKAKLKATVLYAENDGYVNNLFFDVGTAVKAYEPFFSFVSTHQLYVQANMSELDLRNVKPSQKVSIIPRIYLGSKIYHGEVISTNWASSRQVTNARNQAQIVTNNEDNWILLPQRFPVLIKITDYDAVNFPLNVGNSVYIYIHRH